MMTSRRGASPGWRLGLAAAAAVALALGGCSRAPDVVVRQAPTSPSAPSPAPSPSPVEPPAPAPAASPSATIDYSTYTVCSASVTRLSPPAGGRQTIQIKSTLPGGPVSAVAHYGTATQSLTATTDERGRTDIAFKTLSRPRAGTHVQVDVTVGPAHCSTTFTVG